VIKQIAFFVWAACTNRNWVWDKLCAFILLSIKAKNAGDAIASAKFFNADNEQNKKQKYPKPISD